MAEVRSPGRRYRVGVTAARLKVALGAMRAGADLSLAAHAANLSRDQLEGQLEADPEFALEARNAQRFADELVQQSLFHEALKGNTTAIQFWMKNRQPADWRDRHDHTVTSSREQGATIFIDFADGSPAFSPADVTTVPGPSTRQ